MVSSKGFPQFRRGRSSRVARLSSGLQSRDLLGRFYVVRVNINTISEVVDGADRSSYPGYPTPDSKTTCGVLFSITAGNDLEISSTRF